MPETIGALLQALGDASGWAVAVALAVTFAYGFYKGWWVPGFVYQREVKRADENDQTVEQATAALSASNEAAEVISTELRSLQRKLSAVGNESVSKASRRSVRPKR